MFLSLTGSLSPYLFLSPLPLDPSWQPDLPLTSPPCLGCHLPPASMQSQHVCTCTRPFPLPPLFPFHPISQGLCVPAPPQGLYPSLRVFCVSPLPHPCPSLCIFVPLSPPLSLCLSVLLSISCRISRLLFSRGGGERTSPILSPTPRNFPSGPPRMAGRLTHVLRRLSPGAGPEGPAQPQPEGLDPECNASGWSSLDCPLPHPGRAPAV